MIRTKRVLTIAVAHFVAFLVAFLSAFGDTTVGQEQTFEPTIVSQVLGVVVAVLWLPLRLLVPFGASGSFFIDMALLAFNSLIWGIVLDRLVSAWGRGG